MSLLPCPFCGSSEPECVVYHSTSTNWPHAAGFRCPGCAARGPVALGITKQEADEQAREEWNRRAVPAPVDQPGEMRT